jgi:EmrB/QacA subfamily drug resistance transporter
MVTVGLITGAFLAALDAAIVGTAMPTVIASLGGTELYTWVFAAFMLAFTTATLLFGKLSDLFGQRVLYAAAIGLFLLGSGLCGAAQSMVQLIIFRAVQGVGAGGLMAMSLTIVGHVFTPDERPRMQGLMSAMWAIASLAGPAVGGLLSDHLSWRWVFYVNLPVGIVPAALILTHLTDTRRDDAHPVIDFAGAALLAATVLCLLFALLWGPTLGWTAPRVLGLLGATALLLALFVWNERSVREPIVPFALFRLRAFSVCSLENFLTGAALFGIMGFIPLFAQGVLGTSATRAGTTMMPMSIGWPIGSIVAGRILGRFGYRALAAAGLLLMMAGFALLVRLGVDATPAEVGLAMLVVGAGMGTLTPTVTAGVQNAVPRAHMGVASASVAFYRNVGGSIGVSVLGAVLHSRMATAALAAVGEAGAALPATFAADPGDPKILLDPGLLATLPAGVVAALRAALATSLSTVFAVSFVTVAVGLLAAVAFMPGGPQPGLHPRRAAAEGPAR